MVFRNPPPRRPWGRPAAPTLPFGDGSPESAAIVLESDVVASITYAQAATCAPAVGRATRTLPLETDVTPSSFARFS